MSNVQKWHLVCLDVFSSIETCYSFSLYIALFQKQICTFAVDFNLNASTMETKRFCLLAAVAVAFAFIHTGVAAQNKLSGNNAAEILKEKTINVIGDSYVRNHKRPYAEAWHAKFAEKYGMKYNNYGRNGGCVAFDRTKDGFGPSLMVRYKEMEDNADIILIIAGHNDAGMIKNSADSLAMFRDSLDLLLTELQHKYPKGKIGYVTPWYVDRDGFVPVVKTIKKVCKKHHIPVLDNYSKKCVIQLRDENFRRQYFQGVNDTAHLNAEGHELFLPVGEKFILDMMR